MRFIFFLIFILSGFKLFAQNFLWETGIVMPDTSGFHKIYLKPEITAHLTSDFSDIRIFNNHGKEIPYLRKTEKEIKDKHNRKKFPVVEQKHNKRKGYSEIILHNHKDTPVTNISIDYETVEAEKRIKISGSNDRKKWFILNNNITIPPQLSDSSTVEVLLLNFPVSNYKYYKLIVHDFENEPVIIDGIYRYNIEIKNIKYAEIPPPHIKQYDTLENEKSIVFITFDKQYYIDKLKFLVEGPEYFLREANLINIDSALEQKINQAYYNQLNQMFYLSSTEENVLNLNKHRGKQFKLIIDNKDDAPLEVKKIKAYQLSVYLIAYLKVGKSYVIKFGDKKLEKPVYDLRFFEDSIPDELIVASTGRIQKIEQESSKKQKVLDFNLIYLWGAIGVVTLLLVFVSIKMFFELKNRSTNSA